LDKSEEILENVV